MKRLVTNYQNELEYFFENIDLIQLDALFDLLCSCEGLIFFSGVGKSALVAQKIAVTMTSLATKALFIPPLEAMHGDIGLVSEKDIFVALSKSGETEELLQLVPYIRNKGAKVVAIVSNVESRLAKAADFVLNIPVSNELCPFNMAPTVSTTAALILGDILAIAMMEKHRMTLEDYAANHPAGTIGKRITVRVQDLMLQNELIPLAGPEDRVIDILVKLSEKKAGALLVVNQDEILEGIFTDGDLRRALVTHSEKALSMPLAKLMTTNPRTISPKTLAFDALKVMENNQKSPITVLPVVNEKRKVLGLIKMHDIIQSGI